MSGKWRVRALLGDVWLLAGHDQGDRPAGAQAIPASVAVFNLDDWLADAGRTTLAELVEAVHGAAIQGVSASPEWLRGRAREALATGAVRAWFVPHGGGGGRRVEPDEDAARTAPVTAASEDLTWIGIQLVDDAHPEKPVAFRKYRVELPDHTTREGLLDENGRARIAGIPGGECTISFPGTHGEDWS